MTGRQPPFGKGASDEPSLDPRTWLRQGQTEEESSPSDGPAVESFDPRAWTSRDHAPPPSAPTASPPDPGRRALLLGGGAAAAALAAGAAFVLVRGAGDDAPPGEEAEPAVLTSGGTEYVAPAVDGYPGLEERLANYGVKAGEIVKVIAALRPVAGSNPGRMRLTIRLRDAAGGAVELTGAELRRTVDGVGYRLSRTGSGFMATELDAGLARQLVAHPRGQVNRDGLYASAVDTISPELMTQFGEALAFDFDIAQEVREGDQFEVVHQEHRDARGDVVGDRRLLFAFLSAGGKDRYLYRFRPPGGDDAWFDDRGANTKRAFMRTPLDGARITSLFGPRKHPVLHDVFRNHNGVDFGCGIGTHIFAAADGVVDYAGPASGFGVLLKLRHEGGLETWYGHLSGFPADIAAGVKVVQGQLVALSGNVGVSSGPHLHYEVHKDGVPVDPKDFLDVQGGADRTAAQLLTGAALAAFLAFKDEIDLARRSQA